MEMKSIAPHAVLVWAVLFALSILLSFIILKLKKRNFFPRLSLWFVIIPLFILALYFGKWTFFALTTVCFLASYYELTRMIKDANIFLHIISLLAAVPWMITAQLLNYSEWMIIPIVLVMLAVISYFTIHKETGFWNLPVLSFIVGMCFSYWIYLDKQGNFRHFLFVFSVVWLCDIMAFVFGKIMGKYKPFPTISPNKTLAGYLGGFLNAILAGYLFWFAVPELNFFQLTLAGILLAVSATLGDLFGSKIKRLYGLKDFSRILGPMGGIIDRLDSLLFAVVIFFYYLRVISAH
jgi:phosphatidate cytidylyltransferase